MLLCGDYSIGIVESDGVVLFEVEKAHNKALKA
jgi:hypothetical protein